MKKPEKPRKAFFYPQYANLLIGAPGLNIKDGDDLCRFAADKGLPGVNMPIGMIDNLNRWVNDSEYREEQLARYASLGTPLRGVSDHTGGQLGSCHTTYLPRFIDFAPEAERDWDQKQVERAARERFKDGLRLSRLIGGRLFQCFLGGRNVPHHDQWSTLPKHFRELSILHLATQWEDTFKVAAENEQVIAVEVGHVMETLKTVDDIDLFRSFLPEPLRPYVKWGVDPSHMDKEGDNAAAEIQKAIKLDLDVPGHAKSALYSPVKGPHRQNALPFSEQAGKFVTFGTANPESAEGFGNVLWRDHKRSPHGTDAVLEGEDMVILHAGQAMEVGSNNLSLVIDGEDPIPLAEITLLPWDGPTFETFAETEVKVSTLLELNREEHCLLCEAAERVGLPRPN